MSRLPKAPETLLSFGKPPAVEVLFNVRAAVPGDFDPKAFLSAIKKRFPDAFAEHQEFKTFMGQFGVDGNGQAASSFQSANTGYRCVSADQTFMAHYLTQGLTLNFLPHYPGFEEALERLKEHWAVYAEVVGNAPVIAASLRYIDRIDIPVTAESLDMRDYFTFVPTNPGSLHASDTFIQYWLNDGESDARTRVTWSTINDARTDVWSFALDTEVLIDPANFADEHELWAAFQSFRTMCRFVFNEITTEKCRALFQ